MSKRLEAMRQNPRGNWTIFDVINVCREFDIECSSSRSGSSHYKIKHSGMSDILTIPFKRPIKPVYVRKLVSFIDTVRSLK